MHEDVVMLKRQIERNLAFIEEQHKTIEKLTAERDEAILLNAECEDQYLELARQRGIETAYYRKLRDRLAGIIKKFTLKK